MSNGESGGNFANSAAGVAAGIGGDILTGGLLTGLSYGLNAQAASKAHDRSKNWATRHWLYEQIALREAKISPGYIFSRAGAAQQRGGMPRSPQATSSPGSTGNPSRALALDQMENIRANTDLAQRTADQTDAKTADIRAETRGKQLDNMRKNWENNALNTPSGHRGLRRGWQTRGLPKGVVEALSGLVSGASAEDMGIRNFPSLQDVWTAEGPVERTAASRRFVGELYQYARYQAALTGNDIDTFIIEMATMAAPGWAQDFVRRMLTDGEARGERNAIIEEYERGNR